MSKNQSPKKIDQNKGDEVLKRMLKTPPKPKIKDSLTESDKDGDHRPVIKPNRSD